MPDDPVNIIARQSNRAIIDVIQPEPQVESVIAYRLGPRGTDGNTILSGSGAPASGLGSDGDFYLNTDNFDFYGPKTSGSWGSPTPLGAGSISWGGISGTLSDQTDLQSALDLKAAISDVTLNSATDVSGKSWVLDEDNMASDDATKLATQQSIKAYVDSAVSVGGGTWGSITGTLSDQTDLQTELDAKADASHTHAASDIISGAFADARISESSVTQHESALTITESQISDLGSYLTDITGESLDDLGNVTITSIASGEILKWNGSAWVNNTLAEAGIAASSHTHSAADITDNDLEASDTPSFNKAILTGDELYLGGQTSSDVLLQAIGPTLQIRLGDDSGVATLTCGAFSPSGTVTPGENITMSAGSGYLIRWGISSSNVGLKDNGTELQVRLADDSGFGNLRVNDVVVDGTVDGRDIATDGSKLDGIEVGADVTDTTNVDAAGATMNTDTDVSANSWVLDEDDMSSDDDTKLATQQSIKAYVDTEVAAAGGTTINNYSSIGAPQLFNPDATAVTNDTDDYILSSSNAVAFVSLNGQVLDDSEYSLVASTLTVTPDNGFNSTSDEVLVFQHVFSVSADGVITGYATKTSAYTITVSDHTIECTSGTFDVDLLSTASVSTGQEFIIKNSGTGVITVVPDGSETIDGESSIDLDQYDSVTVKSNGTNWIIV